MGRKVKWSSGFILLSVSLVAAGGMSVARFAKHQIYEQRVTGHLKRAADANSLEMAKAELDCALEGIELAPKEGYTSVFWQTPDEDVGFWVTNLRAARDDLSVMAASKTASPLERSNCLIKLRETLIDHGREGDTVTSPDGISIFPHNSAYAVVTAAIAALLVISGGWLALED